jgi:hypothetical protein
VFQSTGRSRRILYALSLSVFALVLAWQLFLPGFVGLANNGDFAKIAGRLCMDSTDRGADNFLFFVARYIRSPESCWDSGLPSSELVLARLASALELLVGPARTFDIRWLGALHAAGLFLGYALWLRLLDGLPLARWIVCNALLILILGDIGYVAYANSFYTDTAAVIGATIMVPSAVLLITSQGGSTSLLVLFAMACILFGASKAQHALPGIGASALVWLLAKRGKPPVTALCAAGIFASCACVIAATPSWYGGGERFDLIFFKLLPSSDDPAADARSLGLPKEDIRYSGMHSFMPGSPVQNTNWFNDFTARTSTLAVIRFYSTHPARALGILHGDLVREEGIRRPLNISNYRREQGYPPGTRTARFGWWSALQTQLSAWWPWQSVFCWASIFVLASRRYSLGESSVILAVLLAGALEFCISSLGDSVETYRHLLLAHLFTDFAILLTFIRYFRPAADITDSTRAPAAVVSA